jgi:hypothetical protein
VRLWIPLFALGTLAAAAAAPRTFIVELGVPGLAVDVNGTAATADAGGTLHLTVDAAAGEVLRFRSRAAAWTLDARRTVPAEDPAIPILWDLTSEVRPAPPPTPPTAPAPPEPAAAAPPPPAADDPCRDRLSIRCRRARWAAFDDAVARRDCAAALAAAGALAADYPELLATADGAAALAAAYLDCGLGAGGERRGALLRRAIEIAAGYGEGELWCRGPQSRLLARAYEVLGEEEEAAASAAAARARCPADGDQAALEWEVYFRFRLGELERCAALAASAPRRLGLFLRAWLELARGECAAAVELEPSGDLPCTGLPQEFCSRQYGRWLLACGHGGDDYAAAARYLRAALPADPADWDDLAAGGDGDRLDGALAELAEAELLSRDYAAAARHFERLLRPGETVDAETAVEEPAEMDAERATLWRLYGDALMLADDGDAGRRAALAAYETSRGGLPPLSLAVAVVTNNVCVHRARLGVDTGADLDALEAALEHLPEDVLDIRRLRLWLTHNLLALRIRRLESDAELGAQEKLVRLQELRAPFAAYQRELEALSGEAHLEAIVHEGRRFALALP